MLTPSLYIYTPIEHHECEDDYFRCQSNTCIPGYFVCDGNMDCGLNDTSDEKNCTGNFLCQIIPLFMALSQRTPIATFARLHFISINLS